MSLTCGFDTGSAAQSDCHNQCIQSGCNPSTASDGICKASCDTQVCGWDFGNCGVCASGCKFHIGTTELLTNGVCDAACSSAECSYDNGACVSESSPAVLYVTASGTGGNKGSLSDPLWSLSDALVTASFPWVQVYLLSGTHVFSPTSTGSLQPLINSTSNIKVSTLFCAESSQSECANTTAIVKLGNHYLSLDVRASLTLTDLVLDGGLTVRPGCDSCTYCPYTTVSGGVLVDDRDNPLDPSNVASQVWCSPYNTLNFIKVTTPGSFHTLRVDIRNFRQQYRALIWSDSGVISFTQTTFENIQVEMLSLTSAVVAQIVCNSPPYGCGSLEFIGGSVSLLNNGYEYRSDLALSGFLVGVGFNSVTFSGVSFTYNYVPIGTTATKTRASLVYLNNLRTLQVANCTFRNNIAQNSIIQLDSGFKIPQVIVNGALLDYNLVHVQVTNSVFQACTVGSGVLKFTYSVDFQNILIQSSTFRGNIGTVMASVLMITAPPLTPELFTGVYQTVTVNGSAVTAFFPPRNVTIQNCTIDDNNSVSDSVIDLTFVPNVYYDGGVLTNNGRSPTGTTVANFTYQSFISNPESYLKHFPNAIQTLAPMYTFNYVSLGSLSIRNAWIENNYSNYAAIFIYGVLSIVMNGLTVIGNTGTALSALSSAITVLSTSTYIEVSNAVFTNNSNIGGLGALVLYAVARVPVCVLTNATFTNNTAKKSAGLLVFGASSLRMTNVGFTNNFAQQTGGAMTYATPAFTSTGVELSIINCIFEQNSVGQFGILQIQSVLGGLLPVLVTIRNVTFWNNTADQGSAVYAGTDVQVNDSSVISNCTFEDNRSTRDGTIYLAYSSGVLTIDDCVFTRNSANQGSAVFLGYSSLPALAKISNSVFTFHTGQNGVLTIPSTLNQPTLATFHNTFLHNANQAIKLTAGVWNDTGSQFLNNTSTQGGAVSLDTDSVAHLTSTSFTLNSASNFGGAISVTGSSNLYCGNCTAVQNRCGVKGAVAYVFDRSVIALANCTLSDNLSLGQASVLYISGSTLQSSLSDSIIQRNTAQSFGSVVLSEASLSVSGSTVQLNTATQLTAGFHMVMSNFTIRNSAVQNQSGSYGSFVYASQFSNVEVESSNFTNVHASEQGGVFSVSQNVIIKVIGCVFHNTTAHESGILQADKDSHIYISDSLVTSCYTLNDWLISVDHGLFSMDNVTFRDIGSGVVVGKILEQLYIMNANIEKVVSSVGNIWCDRCSVVDIYNSEFSNSTVSTSGGVFQSTSTPDTNTKVTVSKSRFQHNSGATGGALYIQEGSGVVTDCTFEENNAVQRGGAIAFICVNSSNCDFNVSSSNFQGNTANVDGGAIYWSQSKPRLSENQYSLNKAQYGANIASFAINLTLLSPNQSQTLVLSSGQVETQGLVVGVIDHYGQIVTTASLTLADLGVEPGSPVILSGVTREQVNGGIATFDNYIVAAEPGTTISLFVSSDSLPATNAILNLSALMRECVTGEFQTSGMCVVCQYGYYSLRPSMECTRCPSTADCYGNFTLVPKPGNWRSSEYTDNILPCANADACIGSPDLSNLSLTGNCAIGYHGNLCNGCMKEYFHSGPNICSECPQHIVNDVTFTLLGVLMLAIAVVLIFTTIRSANRPKSLLSVYIKIFMNYLQLVLAASMLNLNYPSQLVNLNNGQGKIGNFGDQLFSVDCFLDTSDASELISTKLLLLTLCPVMLFGLVSLFWLSVKLALHKHPLVFSKAVASVIVLLFLVHPTLVRVMFSQFNCRTIDPGPRWLVSDLTVQCWVGSHESHTLTVALPCIIVWVIGLPFLTLLYLIAHRRDLSVPASKMKFGFLINGYEEKCYYWEFVILYRKILVICLSVFMNTLNTSAQALTIMIVMLLSLALQHKHTPYINKSLNTLEERGILVSAVTIYCGMYFVSENLDSVSIMVLFLIILLSNAYFLTLLLVLVTGTTFTILMRKFACIRNAVRRMSRVVPTISTVEYPHGEIVAIPADFKGASGDASQALEEDDRFSRADDSQIRAPAQSFDETFADTKLTGNAFK